MLTKIMVALALTVALGTVTGGYVLALIPPQLAYWILYFILSWELTKRVKNGNTENKGTQG
jgi:uncharacterized membrane protein YfcA